MISLNKVLVFLVIECLLVFSAFVAFRIYTIDPYVKSVPDPVLAQHEMGLKESSIKEVPQDPNFETIHLFKELIAKNPPEHEVWHAKCSIAECYQKLGETDKAIAWTMQAYQQYPFRAEPLFSLARYFRLKGYNHNAYMFAKIAKKIAMLMNDAPDSNAAMYDYQLNEELYLSAKETRYRDESFTALNELILSRKTPSDVRETAYRNLIPYVKNIEVINFKKLLLNAPALRDGSAFKYNLANAAIVKTDEGYDVICRTVNYRNRGGLYAFVDPNDRIVRTKNIYAKLDNNLNVVEQREIVENLPRKKFKNPAVEGLEDCRIFKLKGQTWFSCTTTDTNPFGPAQVSLGKLSDVKSAKTIEVESLLTIPGPDLHRAEKNWLPLVSNDELFMFYSYDPYIVFKTDSDNGSCHKIVDCDPGYHFARFRGSAPPVPFDDGHLLLVHEVFRPDTYYFFHRFVYIDRNLVIKKVSKPFYFHHKGIEYSCGLAIDHSGNNLLIPVSREDSDAYIATIDLQTVRSLLEPLSRTE